MCGNSSLEGPGAAGGTFHLKDYLVSTTTLWLPEVLLLVLFPASRPWAAVGAMAAAATGPGPGSGPGDSPEGPEAEAPERRRKAHGMLKLYYGLSEGEAAGRPAGPDPLDPTDLNGAHFDPEVYLDKVCVELGGVQAPQKSDPQNMPPTSLQV